MKANWRTAWQQQAIVVWRDEVEVDRIDTAQIRKVVLVYQGLGDSPGDVIGALVRLADDWVLLPAATGFGGRVHFERQAFWAERACVFWVAEARAALPARWRRNRWLPRSAEPTFARAPAAELDDLVERWPLEGPQTWEERKWQRIEDNRPLARAAALQRRA
jgi:hypothetical protein